MAEKTKRSYPMLSPKNWWLLRKKFMSRIPTLVDSSYLSTVLGMDKRSAENNVLRFLKIIGLIDSEGKPEEDLVKRWRDDKEYSRVCEEIVKNVYPPTLLDAVPDPSGNKDAAIGWFMREAGVGLAAASKMTAFYSLLREADVEGQKETQEVREQPKEKKAAKKEKKEAPIIKTQAPPEGPPGEDIHAIQWPIHIDVQIHLSSDASSDQIDHLFESMAKHLKGFYPGKQK